MRALRDEQTGACVPEIMDAKVDGHGCSVACRIPNTTMEPVVSERAAVWGGEDQYVWDVRKSIELRGEEAAEESRYRDHTNAAGLGFAPVEFSIDLRQRLRDGKALLVDVNTPTT
jgi:hypothetical protein